MRFRSLFFIVLGAAFLAGGCGGEKEDPEMAALRGQTADQLEALKKHHALLNRKLIGINERLNALQVSNTQLAAELAYARSAPDTMRGEIIGEVNRRFVYVAQNQAAFFDTARVTVNRRTDALEARVESGLAGMKAEVANYESLVRFVTAQQDSVNRVLAGRVDRRLWYESILGKWEDLEHARRAQQQ